MIRNLLAAAAALSLAASPAMARSVERASAPAPQQSEIAGNPWIPILVGLALAVAIVIVVADGDDSTSP